MDKRMENNKIVKECLCEALICLMRVKPFGEITITELIKKAGVARATYYRNFSSKEDIAREYISYIVKDFSNDAMEENSTNYENMVRSWKYFDKYKDILVLYNNAGLSELLFDGISNLTYYTLDKSKYPFVDDFYFNMFIGALYSVVRKWLFDGCKVPYEDMAKRFVKTWSSRHDYRQDGNID